MSQYLPRGAEHEENGALRIPPQTQRLRELVILSATLMMLAHRP